MYSVSKVTRNDCREFIIDIHYAGRFPSVSWAFGLYENESLVGVVTYGTPSSGPLRIGIAGKERSHEVIELNRLCLLNNKKNEASYLVSKSLRMLPRQKIVVSYADTSQGHIGTVYQATNFFYCGLSAKRTDWKVKGKEHLHGQTIADEFRGEPNRSQLMRDKYGDKFYLKDRSRKHRYLFIVGSKKYKKQVMNDLNYTIEDYPKGNKNDEKQTRGIESRVRQKTFEFHSSKKV